MKDRKRFSFPLPFDPFRFLLVLLEHLWLLLLVGIICGVLAFGYGMLKVDTNYRANIDLIQERPRNPFMHEAPNAPWKPRPISEEAFLILASNKEIFEAGAAKMGEGWSPGRYAFHVGITQGFGQSLHRVEGRSTENPREALMLATTYAEAIIEHAAASRRAEAREAVALMEKQVSAKRDDAKAVNDQLLAYSSDQDFFDEDKQKESFYEQLTALRKQLADAEIELEANDSQTILAVREGLIGPLRQRLAEMGLDLRPEHHQIRTLNAEISALESQLQAIHDDPDRDILQEFQGQLDADTLSSVNDLRDQREILKARIAQTSQRIKDSEVEGDALPEKVLSVADLKASLNEKLRAAAWIENRLQDAQFYAENAPSSASIFHLPELGDVRHSPKLLKVIALSGIGALGGAGLIGLFLLATELVRRTIRTPLQAAIATHSAPQFFFPFVAGKDQRKPMADFYLRTIARHLPDSRVFLFPVVGQVRGEVRFWEHLLETAAAGERRVIFMDISGAPLQLQPGGRAIPNYDYHRHEPLGRISADEFNPEIIAESLPDGHILIVRWATEPNARLTRLAPHVDQSFFITSTTDSKTGEVEYLGNVYQDLLEDPAGVILVDRVRPGRAKRIIAGIEDWYLEFRQQRLIAQQIRGVPL